MTNNQETFWGFAYRAWIDGADLSQIQRAYERASGVCIHAADVWNRLTAAYEAQCHRGEAA